MLNFLLASAGLWIRNGKRKETLSNTLYPKNKKAEIQSVSAIKGPEKKEFSSIRN